jgi:hypothetical protein
MPRPTMYALSFARPMLAPLVLLLAWAGAHAADWHDFPGGRWSALAVPAAGRTGFQLLGPSETGIAFTNVLREADGAQNRTLYNGSGVAAGDFDGDGRPDIVLAGLEGKLSLFRNLGGWRFADVTAQSGVVATNFMARGVVLADLNADGALDLLLSANGAGVRCWLNDGHGHFTDFTTNAGTASRLGSMTMALADVDGNGTPDLYIANNRTDDIRDRGQVKLISVKGQVTVPPALTNRLVLQDGQLLEYGEPDRLLLNDGTGQFRPASWTNGTFLDEAGQPLTAAPLDWGLTATFRDLNGDGAPDLYVCNDFWTPDRFWLNDGAGHFRAAPALALRQTSGSSMGVDMADVNGDGLPDLFVVDMLSRSPAWRKRQQAAQAGTVNLPGAIADRPQSLRNTLQLARGDGTYAEVAEFAGLAAAEWAWQPLFLDVDLDGRPDLLITSGHAHDVQDIDAQILVDGRQRSFDGFTNAVERRLAFTRTQLANMRLYPELATPIVAFHNRGDLHFDDVTGEWGTGLAAVHHGIATADFDGDGDLDLVVNNLNAPAALYRNESAAPRIAVRLVGRAPNTQAVGAVVTLLGGAGPIQQQEVVLGGRYLSGSDPQLMFAAGKPGAPLTLEVRWRNGKRREIPDVQGNRLYEVAEDATLDQPVTGTSPAPPAPLFADVTGALGHRHQETLFDDFARQPLLPRRLSQAGPGVAWLDWDGDGWEDLAIGSGGGGQLAVFRNDQHGGFTLATNLPAERDQVALVAAGRQLFIAESNYEDGQTNGPAVQRVEKGQPPSTIFPATSNAVGTLALADLDGDGDLDLFIGGRVIPGRWPEAAASTLLRNEGGNHAVAQTFDRLGLVTSAVWSDLTGDGLPELVLACEWGPLKCFRNEHGKLVPWAPETTAPETPGTTPVPLSRLTGWWSGVAAGDFDGDGRLDLIAANWGENSPYHATPELPQVLLAGDWSGDGSLGIVETVFDPERKALTVARPQAELSRGLPFLAGRFASHRVFSELSLDQVLGPQRPEAQEWRAVELRSLVLLNRGDHFETHPLPPTAQLAPAFSPVVADFDGDGHEDVFLSQNFSATRPGVARLDAGRGLLLRGDGRGGFTAMPGQASGMLIYGEQRGAATADFDHDGRPDLVVSQNGAATRLFRNVTGKAGVRVRLMGPPGNPDGLGAVVRIRAGGSVGPAREIHGGSGQGSQDSAVVILALPEDAADTRQIEVRWPGGATSSTSIYSKSTEATATAPPLRH